MNQRDSSALVIDAPVGRHFVQVHHDPQERLHSIGLFVQAGLRLGDGIAVIAVEEDHLRLTHRLRKAGVDVPQAVQQKQLTILDSRAMLATFMDGPLPDWRRFRDVMGAVLARAQSAGTTRVYGDLVSVLWREGRTDAASRLEECWNELGRLYPFSLYCSYTLDGRHENRYANLISAVGCTHTDVLTSARHRVRTPVWGPRTESASGVVSPVGDAGSAGEAN
jgi:hypothetical protein